MSGRPHQLLATTSLLAMLATIASVGWGAPPPQSDGVRVLRVRAAALGRRAGVVIGGDGFGSDLAAVPGRPGELYGLCDRGPNVDGPQPDSKVFPFPSFQPAIGRFRMRGPVAELVGVIGLRDESGAPLNGLVPSGGSGSTGESAFDTTGAPLPSSPNGVDTEGLAALPDGTFWVSDEYGPSLLHFGADGRLLERLTPFGPNKLGRRLPAELARRVPNRGIEALTVAPDGTTLVFVMQSALANDVSGSDAKATAALRLVTFATETGATHTYLYLLDDPASLATSTSAITPVSATEFLVLEHDVKYPSSGSKRKVVYEISLRGATDVARPVGDGTTLDPQRGLLLDGETIERRIARMPAREAEASLAAAGIRAVTKRLRLDVNALLLSVDPAGKLFAHDKVEGIALLDGGRTLVLANDCDFGVAPTAPPSTRIAEKVVPSTGQRDVGEMLFVDLDRLPPIATKHD